MAHSRILFPLLRTQLKLDLGGTPRRVEYHFVSRPDSDPPGTVQPPCIVDWPQMLPPQGVEPVSNRYRVDHCPKLGEGTYDVFVKVREKNQVG